MPINDDLINTLSLSLWNSLMRSNLDPITTGGFTTAMLTVTPILPPVARRVAGSKFQV
ncbi:MAG: hypothetical protein LBD79_00065 [Treponema sp.]|nr:hypothetical protein [Treponema sp.]